MPPEPLPVSTPARRPRQASGEARYQQVLALEEAGLPTRTIAKRLGVGQRTIQHWLAQEHGPYAGRGLPRPEGTRLVDALSAAVLGRGRTQRDGSDGEELKAKGFTGSSRSVASRVWPNGASIHASVDCLLRLSQSLARLSKTSPQGRSSGGCWPVQGSFAKTAEAQLDQITQMDGTLAQARELTHGFLDLIRHHSGEGLDAWLKDVRASTVREFLTFAKLVSSATKPRFWLVSHFPTVPGLWRDTSIASNPICRQAYGRAELSYLQHRFAASCLIDVVCESLHQ
jgi:hypothetical protein